MIEGLSFPSFRRVATMIMVPGAPPHQSVDRDDLHQLDRSSRCAARWMRAHLVSEDPIDLDKHRGMAAQKATDIRRVVTEIEANAKLLRDRQGAVEMQILAVPASSWSEAVAKARYVLNLITRLAWRRPIRITATSSRLSLRTLPGSTVKADRTGRKLSFRRIESSLPGLATQTKLTEGT